MRALTTAHPIEASVRRLLLRAGALFLALLAALLASACTAEQQTTAQNAICANAVGRAVTGVVTLPFQALGGAAPCASGAWSGYGSSSPQDYTAPGGPCESTAGDDACLRCMKAACCTEVLAFASEPLASCLSTCRADKTLALCLTPNECGSADAALNAVQSCAAADCSTDCGGAP